MSMHSSLKGAAKIRTKRNVLKRFERVDSLKKDGRWRKTVRMFCPKPNPKSRLTGDPFKAPLKARCFFYDETATSHPIKNLWPTVVSAHAVFAKR